MTRTRCPSCICGFDGINNREGIPARKNIQNMTLDSFIDLMHTLGVTYDPNGNQEIVLGGNLDGMCQQIRGAYAKRITVSRIDIARILDAKITEVAGC